MEHSSIIAVLKEIKDTNVDEICREILGVTVQAHRTNVDLKETNVFRPEQEIELEDSLVKHGHLLTTCIINHVQTLKVHTSSVVVYSLTFAVLLVDRFVFI